MFVFCKPTYLGSSQNFDGLQFLSARNDLRSVHRVRMRALTTFGRKPGPEYPQSVQGT